MTHVLIVEDEESFSDPLSYSLRKEGFDVDVAADGVTALEIFRRSGADIVLLDLMLPGMSGTEVCRELRKDSDVPVIMVTAKDSEVDKVVGLEIGADDYVTKPYSYRELLARMRAVMRRKGEAAPASTINADVDELGAYEVVTFENIVLDEARHTVTISGELVDFPPKEFDLLALFMRHPDRVLPRLSLIDEVWGNDYVGDTKTLDVHVKRLRAKIEQDPSDPRLLVTVRGVGYRLVAPR